jgi:hypothetical protein
MINAEKQRLAKAQDRIAQAPSRLCSKAWKPSGGRIDMAIAIAVSAPPPELMQAGDCLDGGDEAQQAVPQGRLVAARRSRPPPPIALTPHVQETAGMDSEFRL